MYPETRDDRYLIPDSTTPAISTGKIRLSIVHLCVRINQLAWCTEIPKVTQELATSEDPARQEILACLSDITPPPSADSSSNVNSEIVAPLPGNWSLIHYGSIENLQSSNGLLVL